MASMLVESMYGINVVGSVYAGSRVVKKITHLRLIIRICDFNRKFSTLKEKSGGVDLKM